MTRGAGPARVLSAQAGTRPGCAGAGPSPAGCGKTTEAVALSLRLPLRILPSPRRSHGHALLCAHRNIWSDSADPAHEEGARSEGARALIATV